MLGRYYSEDGGSSGCSTCSASSIRLRRTRRTPPVTQIWACDRPGEKRAFEELIDFITERRARHPGLHVYHYNHYEPTSVDHLTELHGTRQEAVGALMGCFATREDEVDDLFRLGCSPTCTGSCGRACGPGGELLHQAASRCAGTTGGWTWRKRRAA